MIRNPGCQSGWKRFFAGRKKLPSHPRLCLSHRQQKQIKSHRRLFHSSLLSVCWLSAPVLTDPQRSFHGAPGLGISPQAGEKKRSANRGDSQSRSLRSEPKDNHKFSIFTSEETGAASSLAPDTFLPAELRCRSEPEQQTQPGCSGSASPLISPLLKPSRVHGEGIRQGGMDLEQRGWQRAAPSETQTNPGKFGNVTAAWKQYKADGEIQSCWLCWKLPLPPPPFGTSSSEAPACLPTGPEVEIQPSDLVTVKTDAAWLFQTLACFLETARTSWWRTCPSVRLEVRRWRPASELSAFFHPESLLITTAEPGRS